jgi:hypothetical protein
VLEDIDCSVKFTNSRAGGRSRNAGMMMMPGITLACLRMLDDPLPFFALQVFL